MLDSETLTFDREQMTPLDDAALASIAGGDGPKEWVLKKLIDLLVDCFTGSLDDIISAAKEGYEDAR
jgi:hypothetical protein